jgi:hypothetical protein
MALRSRVISATERLAALHLAGRLQWWVTAA